VDAVCQAIQERRGGPISKVAFGRKAHERLGEPADQVTDGAAEIPPPSRSRSVGDARGVTIPAIPRQADGRGAKATWPERNQYFKKVHDAAPCGRSSTRKCVKCHTLLDQCPDPSVRRHPEGSTTPMGIMLRSWVCERCARQRTASPWCRG